MKKTLLALLMSIAAGALRAQVPASASTAEAQVLTIEGEVQVFPVAGTGWTLAQTNVPVHFGDRLRTGPHSRATVRLSQQTVLRVNELTTLVIQPPSASGKPPTLSLEKGGAYFFSRERPTEMEFRTPLTAGAIRGTEFNLTVADDDRTVVSLIDGAVALSNQLGHVEMVSGEQGVVETGKPPVKSPMLEAMNIIQWCLYYPGVLDADELEFSTEERSALAASLAAYRSGDLLQAVALYPTNQPEGSASEQVYRAAVLLSVGQVEQAESLLAKLKPEGAEGTNAAKCATALSEVIAVVKNQPGPRAIPSKLATESLAESYYFQSHAQLAEALHMARASVAASPNFGFGWARVAELELSFGRLPEALAALDKSLQLAPRNSQSVALRGFIELAQARPNLARASFDQAIALDGALGNAWLGRGLCEIWNGHVDAGRQDIQVAVASEPQRAELRSYLGKAYSATGDGRRALKELALAQKLDPNDPTAWLYRALVEQKGNEINSAVRDLEESKKLNDNERLFRSKLLLDEDQAVRSANLARIYQDTGPYTWNKDTATSDWSVGEASRALSYDYANYSAHQFLADSYDALRDPQQTNLRYETPWFDELMMSDLLSPASAGNLSEFSSQRQYARLFEQNHFGASSDTEYLSNGSWLQKSSQFGNYDDYAYAVDDEYRSQNGWRNNNDSEDNTASVKAKVQLTPQDILFLEGVYYYSTFGDVAQYYNQYGTVPGVQPTPSSTFQGKEWQQPNIFLGYNHEWAPGVNTLLLGGYLNDTLNYTDPQAVIPVAGSIFAQPPAVTSAVFPVSYRRDFDAYSVELQQMFRTEQQTLVVGGRVQEGWNNTYASEVNLGQNPNPTVVQPNLETTLKRYTVYGYETLKLFDQLQLMGGFTYDYLDYPVNIENAPITSAQTSIDQWSPKAGFIWAVTPETFLRFAYTRSLGGLSFDNSVRLEPTQVGGFNQAFRSIIPESVVGVVPGSRFTQYAVGVDRSFKSNTYITLEGQILDSDATRGVGAFSQDFLPIPENPITINESLDYTEQSIIASVNQLVGDHWSGGGRYQISHAELNSQYPGYSTSSDQSAQLQQLTMYLNYYHTCGFFSQFQSIWTHQADFGYNPSLSSSDFWQFNAYAGYRFLHRAAEIKVGLLNLTDQNYLLNPLNLNYDMPRGRTLAISFKFYF